MTERKAIAKRTRNYPEETIELGLRAMVLCSGNSRKASKALATRGVKVPRSTLQRWKAESHSARYQELYEGELASVRKRMAVRSEELADYLADLEWKVAGEVERKLGDMSPEQAASALRNVTTSKGINIDKSSVLRGLPTEVHAADQRTLPELIRALSRFEHVLPGLKDSPLIGTAEEIVELGNRPEIPEGDSNGDDQS